MVKADLERGERVFEAGVFEWLAAMNRLTFTVIFGPVRLKPVKTGSGLICAIPGVSGCGLDQPTFRVFKLEFTVTRH